MIKSYRVKIYPDKNQSEKIIQFCNAARFAYNWAIAEEQKAYEELKTFIPAYVLTTLWTQFKKQEGNEWLKDISARATKIAVLNAAKAYENFFKKRAKFPKFKKKGKSKMSCATHEQTIAFTATHCRLEKLGWVKIGSKNYVPFGDGVKYLNPKLEFDGVSFWLSVAIELDDKPPDKPYTEGIGVDLGLKTLAVCSNGTTVNKPNIVKLQKKLRRLQRQASRHYQQMIDYCRETKIKFHTLQKSKNLLRLEIDILKLHQKISNVLNTNIHMFTASLIKLNPEFICIEDLNVSGMMKNRHFSKKIQEAKFAEIRRQLEYKGQWNNIPIIVADRWFPSSKMCSNCGCKKDKLSLNERTYHCEECGYSADRDLNASYNLRKYGELQLSSVT